MLHGIAGHTVNGYNARNRHLVFDGLTQVVSHSWSQRCSRQIRRLPRFIGRGQFGFFAAISDYSAGVLVVSLFLASRPRDKVQGVLTFFLRCQILIMRLASLVSSFPLFRYGPSETAEWSRRTCFLNRLGLVNLTSLVKEDVVRRKRTGGFRIQCLGRSGRHLGELNRSRSPDRVNQQCGS